MKRYILQRALILVILLMCVSAPVVSYAESSISDRDVEIELNPEIPIPGKDVTITLSSYATDLNKAQIEWRDGSNNILSTGSGKKSYTIRAGASNSNIVLQVSITPLGDTTPLIKQFSIRPSEVDILWQVDNSHTPPFYKGKALATNESTIRAVALPASTSAKGGGENIVYLWKLEHTNISQASGYGKDSFIFKNSYLRNVEKIEVNASGVNGRLNAKNTINVPILEPKLLFYAKNSDGVINYNQAIGEGTRMYGEESTIVAEPYFFPLDNARDLTYAWRINGNSINTPKNPRVLTIRPTSTGGYATISLSIESISKLFQSVAENIKLNL